MIQTPYLSTKRVSTTPAWKSSGLPTLKLVGGSNSTLGNMNRPIVVTQPPIATVKPTQATAAQEKKPRRVTPSAAAAAAGAGWEAGGGAFAVPLAAAVPVAAAAAATAAGAGFGAALSAAGAGAAFAGAASPGGWVTRGALVPPATAGTSATGVGDGGALNVSEGAAGAPGAESAGPEGPGEPSPLGSSDMVSLSLNGLTYI